MQEPHNSQQPPPQNQYLGEVSPDGDGADSHSERPGLMLGSHDGPAEPLQPFPQHVLPVDAVRHPIFTILIRRSMPVEEAAPQQTADQVLVSSAYIDAARVVIKH